jgi:hypothetical protein
MIGFKGGLDEQEFACRRNAKIDVLAKAVAAGLREPRSLAVQARIGWGAAAMGKSSAAGCRDAGERSEKFQKASGSTEANHSGGAWRGSFSAGQHQARA